MQERELTIQTSKGELKAVRCNDDSYPGFKIYLNQELYAAIELYEENNILRGHLYNDIEQEPIVSKTLSDFN